MLAQFLLGCIISIRHREIASGSRSHRRYKQNDSVGDIRKDVSR